MPLSEDVVSWLGPAKIGQIHSCFRMHSTTNLRSFQAVILDLDGTLVDTLGDFEVALNGMFGDLQLPPIQRDEVAPLVGQGSEHLIRAVLRRALPTSPSRDDALYEPAWQSYQRHYRAINGQFATVFSGVVAGLQFLQSLHLPMACLTNKPTTFAKELLLQKGLTPYFSHVFGGDAFAKKKPDPLPLLKTCETLGMAPAQVLMVGDSSNDAQAARAAGCPVCLLTYGYNHGQPVRQVDADGFLDSLAQLPAFFADAAIRLVPAARL